MAIENIFVLMLENRSFDHVLGFSNITGEDAVTGEQTKIRGIDPAVNGNPDPDTGQIILAKTPADFSIKDIDIDPGHEFENVLVQLGGTNAKYPDPATHGYPEINNEGFISSYKICGSKTPDRIMNCFSGDQLPVLHALAKEFAVCDNWFSSLPGPTWPNRFFMLAATSGGLSKSPTTTEIIAATGFKGYGFEHGNIFDALDKKNIPWVIFEGDKFPVSFALKGMNHNAALGRFLDFSDFEKQLSDPAFKNKFIFIEPKYGKHSFDITGPGDFSGGNSMHPLDDATHAEALVKAVYETLRQSPLWEKSVLMIIFDEHGGFYDHVQPPSCVAPGDQLLNATDGGATQFRFNQLGVRVPVIIVSPLIKKGIIDHTQYDHASALATVEKLLGMDPLTQRDRQANDLLHLFKLQNPRTDTPATLPDPAHSASATLMAMEPEETAASLQQQLVELDAMSLLPGAPAADPIATHTQVGFAYVALLKILGQEEDALQQKKWIDEFTNIKTRKDAARFMTKAKLKVYFGQDATTNL